MKDIKCGECGAEMVLRDSRYGKFLGCSTYPICDATHSVHQTTGEPMGIPTNKEGKKWRMQAHDAFDPLWRGENKLFEKRNHAYKWLADAMGISREECHIGMFSIEQCKKVIELVENYKEAK